MKNRTGVAALIVCGVLGSSFAAEPEKKEDDRSKGTYGDPANDESKQGVSDPMMADMQPGPQHKLLEGLAGTWACVTRHWMDPAQPGARIEHEVRSSMILGGRFLRIETTGDFFGVPFESLTIMGYDRRHERYTIVGFDTLGTYFVTAEGSRDEESKSLRLKGTTHDPKTGATERYTFVYRDITPESYVSEVWFTTPDEREVKVVESTCTRTR
ncbi:MAG: DUF1579 family protein [Phycisphaerae bacterium]|nr:DUF1579 family protein [Phycisphaerae bacterium]